MKLDDEIAEWAWQGGGRTYDDESLDLSWADDETPKIRDAVVDPAVAPTLAGCV